MLGLPKTTEFNKRIPKQKFYEHINVTPALRRIFIDQIKVIYWRNKIAPSTISLQTGTDVTEIEIFEIKLNSTPLDVSVLQQMDKEIPYHIIFLLNYERKYQVWTAYKEKAGNGSNAFKVDTYFHTDWFLENELVLKLDGLNMDAVYENYVRQIAGDDLYASADEPENLKEFIERSQKIQLLQKQIDTLQKKIRREKQLNRQMELNKELKKIKKQLEEMI